MSDTVFGLGFSALKRTDSLCNYSHQTQQGIAKECVGEDREGHVLKCMGEAEAAVTCGDFVCQDSAEPCINLFGR